ncbi:MAG: hypothetical protein HQK60_12405 [Deltaproteobacteria bacterium]|nr:hypothetical protein [Deltaproteobacteria bacterium]
MGWSLGYLPPKEPELLDAFFLALGKALYLANAFESKCQFVLRIAKQVYHYKAYDDSSATMAFMQSLKDNMLGQTINELKLFPEFTPADIALLKEAKEARNFIAHESADLGYLSSISAKQLWEHIDRLREEVDKLVAGDNLVSRWVYEIEDKEAAPREIQKNYAQWVQQWIFGSFDFT